MVINIIFNNILLKLMNSVKEFKGSHVLKHQEIS